MPLPVTVLPPIGGSEPETTNSKLDVGVDKAGGYVCRIFGTVGARFCADYMSVRYFVLLSIGLVLVSGMAMVRLAPALKANGRSTTLLVSEQTNDANKLPDLQNSSITVAVENAEECGRISTLVATSPLFKRTMTDRKHNLAEATPICWACGGSINATDRYCSSCGAPKKLYSQVTSETSTSKFCSDATFCPKCGGKVSSALQFLTYHRRSPGSAGVAVSV